ncbi:hypothetical protein ACIHEJ_35315 [Streptomyces sp. NPDC052301]|uniref:hypothetical protein n=1 Tax=Streptomyces sp. NPDC052301 TaxID=3365687 RepID=UPI0037D81C1B
MAEPVATATAATPARVMACVVCRLEPVFARVGPEGSAAVVVVPVAWEACSIRRVTAPGWDTATAWDALTSTVCAWAQLGHEAL